jgi:uncharacterized protein (DUF1778 family)
MSDEKKKPNRKKSVMVSIRVTPEDAKRINKKIEASKLSKSDFLLRAIDNTNVVLITDLTETIIELKRQGHNLNQAVKYAHETGGKLQALNNLNAAIKECRDAYETLIALSYATENNLVRAGRYNYKTPNSDNE